jgi:hypothetical protein
LSSEENKGLKRLKSKQDRVEEIPPMLEQSEENIE